uniref:Uncharacterized protein n=1 Tax=Panagrolaimus superbus TaxID=310955 RepID=A0A914ZCL0_9BILA
MFFAILLALIAIGAGYYIHKQFSRVPATPEVSIPEGSKIAASKRDVLGAASNRSVYNTAAQETSLRSVTGGTQTQTLETGDKSAVEQPQRDESSRDVKTARSPTPAEHPSYAAVAGVAPSTATVATTDDNNNVQLVKDSDGGADPVSKSPTAKTAIIPTESERFRGELGNLPDSTARNSSPNPGASNLEVKPDPATASALSEKKKVKKRSSGAHKSPKKSKVSKKSNEIKSSDGGASD